MKQIGLKNDKGKGKIAVLFMQFPRALQAIVKCSEFGHNKYELDDNDWTNYQLVEGGEFRYRNAGARHELERAFSYYDDGEGGSGLPHIFHKAWNALAELELHLINVEKEKICRKNGRNY